MKRADVVAERRALAFPKPIVVIRMSREQYDIAMREGGETERAWLADGLKAGQIEISASAAPGGDRD